MEQVFEVNNWRVWDIAAVDENGQPFTFFAYAQDEEGALEDKAEELRGLRVTGVDPVRN